MEQNGQLVDTIIFEDKKEGNIDFNLDEHEKLRIVAINRLKEIKFNQKNVVK